jgi:hypothetical protein
VVIASRRVRSSKLKYICSICTYIFKTGLKENLDLDLDTNFPVSNLQFQTNVFALHSSTQTSRSVRIVTGGNAITNQLVNRNLSFSLPLSAHGKKKIIPELICLYTMIYEMFSWKEGLIKKGAWVALLLHIHEVPGSNLHSDTDYSD